MIWFSVGAIAAIVFSLWMSVIRRMQGRWARVEPLPSRLGMAATIVAGGPLTAAIVGSIMLIATPEIVGKWLRARRTGEDIPIGYGPCGEVGSSCE